jgi:hypothetical protein
VFLHPDTVAQTGGQAVFPTIRDVLQRGTFDTMADGRHVLRDDNTSPTLAFLWAAGRTKGPDVQYNHVWNDFTQPRRLHGTVEPPCHAGVPRQDDRRLQPPRRRRRPPLSRLGPLPLPSGRARRAATARRLRRARPGSAPAAVATLESALRDRLRTNPKSRPALAARTIGWLYSDWQPDPTI